MRAREQESKKEHVVEQGTSLPAYQECATIDSVECSGGEEVWGGPLPAST
jgi:hypothetical protein